MNSTSIVDCSASTNGCSTILFQYGNHYFDLTNLSNHISVRRCPLDTWDINLSYEKYCNFENNIATDNINLLFHKEFNHNSDLHFCNILNNSILGNDEGTIYYYNHNLYLDHCSIINNNGSSNIQLFYRYGTISCELINCFLDNPLMGVNESLY
jgi:hypothetical protein